MKNQISTVAALFVAVLGAYAQTAPKQATINGYIKGLQDSVVHIYLPVGDSSKTVTMKVKDGHFSWKGNVAEPEKIYLATSQRYVQFYVENANIKINGNIDSLDDLRITGSKAQDEFEAYNKSLDDITTQQNELYKQYDKVKDSAAAKAAWEKQLDVLRNETHTRADAYIKAHPASGLSVSLIADRAVMGDYNELNSLYQQLTPGARSLAVGKRLGARLVILKRSAVGQPFIDFAQNDVNGKPVRLSDYKGKYVLLDFWASWCGPCRAENPNVLKTYDRFKDKNFTIVGVSLDDSGDKWKKAIAEDKMPWMQVSDLKGWKNQVATQYGIQAIPCSFLIDPNGIIIAKDLRGEALPEKLATILN